MAGINTSYPGKTGRLSRVATYFSETARTERALSRLTERHWQYAVVLKGYPDKAEILRQRGDIPEGMKVGGGVLSVYVDALDFSLDTESGEEVAVRVLGAVAEDTPDTTQVYDQLNPDHRRAARLANRAVREHLGTLQLHY